MLPKPAHLTKENAARFENWSVVERYSFRLPYPNETFDILVGLITDEPRAVLDVGVGTGDIARNLVTRVERVDAVDRSEAMIRKGKTLLQGDHPNLHWISGEIEHYIASFHSRSSLSLEHMPPEDATAFDAGVRELVEPWSDEGYIQLQCIGSIVWGTPLAFEK